MRLKDEGTFFVGNKMITTNPGDVSINGVYVHFRIPVDRRSPWPVIMVHGSGTGITYETTPDGREGWATYFVRQGYAVYVIDAAGRGRSGFNGTRVNQAKAEGNLAAVPNLVATTHREVWQRSRFGPEPYVWWPDTQFPTDALQQYLAQLVPLAESTLEGGEDNTSNGLAVLLDKIGPSVMIVHSLGANYARRVLSLRPGKIKALIDLEGRMLCTPQPNTEEIKSSFVPVPFLLVAGDRGWAGEPVCRPAIAAIRAAGGNATYMHLPDKGLKGNTHLMMMDKNNLKVADVILGWIAENVRSRS
jgi:pimeloyl-ACP methyl ester carboxylesterase